MLSELRHQERALSVLHRAVEGTYRAPLLLVGPEGVGKRFAIHQTARLLFCTGTKEHNCRCVDCAQVLQGTHPDFFDLSASSGKDIGVDAVREMVQFTYQAPIQSSCRVFFIDGADRFTVGAANALLKTLEEPPQSVRFFLSAESQKRVLPTIRSRCGLVPFSSLPEDFILSRVRAFESDGMKALVYARLGEGSVGRAIQYCGSAKLALRDRVLGILTQAVKGDVPGLLVSVDQLEKDLPLALRFMSVLAHDVVMVKEHPERLVNQDIREALVSLCHRGSWFDFRREVDELVELSRNAKIQLPFHTKSLLLDAFVAKA